MVSFNCDGCGDVVKKPKLDQHFHSRCRAPFTCLDCSTQFNSPGEWKPHTSCISEEAKYQKSVYKGPKGKGKSGEQQQAQKSAEAPEQASAPVPGSVQQPVESPAEETSSKKKENKRKREEKMEAEGAADSSASAPVEKKKKKDKSKKEDKPSESESAEQNSKKEKKKKGKGNTEDAGVVAKGKAHVDISASLAAIAQGAGKEGKPLSEVLDECASKLSLDRSAVLDRMLAGYKLKVGKKGDLVLFGGEV